MVVRRGALCVALISLSVLAAACNDGSSSSAAEPPRIEVKAAVAPFEAVNVTSSIDGSVASISVQEGAAVRKGDVVATLTNPSVDRDLAYARAQLAAARARLRPRRADNAIAEEVLRQKQAKLERYRALLKSGDVARQDVQDVEAEVAAAKREVSAAQIQREDPDVIEAEIERARADEAVALHRRSLLTIMAPANGVITNLRVHAGDDVFPRDTLAEIVDASSARVRAEVAPELLRFLHAGAPVDVRLLTVPPRTFREPVSRIDAAASSISIIVPNPDRLLRPGTPAVIVVQ